MTASLFTNNVGVYGNAADRELGNYWEREFLRIAALFGFEGVQVAKMYGATIERNGNRFIMPDAWIIRRGDKQFACEVKHKTCTRHGTYGLEEYRHNGLQHLQDNFPWQHGECIRSLYVIHDHNGERHATENIIHHWHAQTIDALSQSIRCTKTGKTYYNGEICERPIHYYPVTAFVPLLKFLA